MTELLFVLLMIFAIGLHEFGHFITAKKFGIKVDKFFIGFGPKIWSTKRGETEYGFNWIPVGGFVRIAGMNPFEEISLEDRERVFKSKKPWQRAIVLAAGSTTHFLLAFIVLAMLLMTAGVQDGDATTTVDSIEAKTPAATAGFQPGDEIVALDGLPVTDWKAVREYIRSHPGATVVFTVRRDETTKELPTALAPENPTHEKVGFLGVSPTSTTVRRAPHTAVLESGKFIGVGSWETLKALGRLVSPSMFSHLYKVLTSKEDRRADDPASVVGLTRLAGTGGIAGLFFLFVSFNVFVGVANLLPLLPLDGGHLAVLAYEKLSRRDVDMRRLIPITATVVTLLAGLFVITLYLDIVQPLPALPG